LIFKTDTLHPVLLFVSPGRNHPAKLGLMPLGQSIITPDFQRAWAGASG
jgi:hypothetical protein